MEPTHTSDSTAGEYAVEGADAGFALGPRDLGVVLAAAPTWKDCGVAAALVANRSAATVGPAPSGPSPHQTSCNH